jgi:putative tricarboxylic transport membrane protein
MSTYDRMSTLFWIGVAFAICIESIRLGLGSLSNPGPGLVPFGSGLILGTLGLIVLGFSFKGEQQEKITLWDPGTQWGKMISVLLSLIAYGFLLDLMGFLLITFLWMVFMCRGIGKIDRMTTILIAVITTSSCYLLFEYYLGIRFPQGIWRS